MYEVPDNFLFEDEIWELLRRCSDGDTFTLENGTILLRVWKHVVDDDGIPSHVTEYIRQDGTKEYTAMETIYATLESGTRIFLNGTDITKI